MPAKRQKPLPPRPAGRFRPITSCYDGALVGWSIYPDDLPGLVRRQQRSVGIWLALRVPSLSPSDRRSIAAEAVRVALRSGGIVAPALARQPQPKRPGGSR
jgi:hypothetical protein